MDFFQDFMINGTKHNIDILWDNGHPLFRASEIGNILELADINKSIKSFDDDEKEKRKILTANGTQDVLFLKEVGLYRLIMTSRKPNAKPFQKLISKIIGTISKTGNYIQNKELNVEKIKQDSLIEANKNKNIIFIGKIKNIDDKILIIIGYTNDIYTQNNNLTNLFESFSIINILECDKNETFKNFLHKHIYISPYKYKENKETSDTFLVTQTKLDEIINIANHNKFKFCNVLNQEQIDPVIMLQDFRKHTQARGNKIQKYSEDGKKLLKTYESFAYAMRDVDEVHVSRNCIKNAIDNNITYKNFRWAELAREMPDDTFQTLNETVEKKKNVKNGFVAMLNLDKNKIVEVFCDQKEAGIQRKMTSTASICQAIKRGSLSSGHYFVMWADCSKNLQDEYLSRSKLPVKRVNGIEILQLHPITDKVIEKYVCIEDVIKKFKISRQTLKSACEFCIIAKGYKWQFK